MAELRSAAGRLEELIGHPVSLREYVETGETTGAGFISFEPMTSPINPFASDRTHLAPPGSAFRVRFEIAVAEA